MLALSCVVMTPSNTFSAQQFTDSIVMPLLQSPSGSGHILSVSEVWSLCAQVTLCCWGNVCGLPGRWLAS